MTVRVPAGATFAACLLIATLATALAIVGSAPVAVRAPLALVTALFVPGYLLVAAVFPDPRQLGPLLRAGLSLACSFAAVIAFSLLIAMSPLDRSASTQLVAVDGGVAVLAVAAALRHRALPPALPSSLPVPLRLPGWDRYTVLAALLGVVLVVAVAVGVVAPGGGDTTAMSFVGIAGPTGASQALTLTMDVASREAVRTSFRLVVIWQGETLGASPTFSLSPGQTVRQTLSVPSPPGTGPTALGVRLLKLGATAPYRQLTVWARTIPFRPAGMGA